MHAKINVKNQSILLSLRWSPLIRMNENVTRRLFREISDPLWFAWRFSVVPKWEGKEEGALSSSPLCPPCLCHSSQDQIDDLQSKTHHAPLKAHIRRARWWPCPAAYLCTADGCWRGCPMTWNNLLLPISPLIPTPKKRERGLHWISKMHGRKQHGMRLLWRRVSRTNETGWNMRYERDSTKLDGFGECVQNLKQYKGFQNVLVLYRMSDIHWTLKHVSSRQFISQH